MQRFLPVVGLTALAVVFGSGVQAVRADAPDDLIPAAALDEAKLAKYWQCPIPLEPGEQITELFLLDEMLYASTTLGVLFAIDADVGLVRWSIPVVEPPFKIFRPCHPVATTLADRMRTVVASPMTIKVVQRLTGKLLAEMEPTVTPSGSPVADEDSIYIGTVTDRFVSLRVVNEGIYAPTPRKKGLKYYAIIMLPEGERFYYESESLAEARQWQREWMERLGGRQPERKTAIRRWQFGTEGNVIGQPILSKRVAIVASDGGAIFAVGLYKRTLEWKQRVPGGILAAPLLGMGNVYVATNERSIYAFDESRGTKRWQCLVPTPILRNGCLTKKMLYYPAEPQGLFAVDPKTGQHVWTFDQGREFLAEHKDSAFVFEPGQAIHQIDVTSGELIRSIPCPEATVGVSNARDETMYVCSPGGRLMCIRPENVPYLRRAQFDLAMQGVQDADEVLQPAKTATTKRVLRMRSGSGQRKATTPRAQPRPRPAAKTAPRSSTKAPAKSTRAKSPGKATRKSPAAKPSATKKPKRYGRDSNDKPPGY